MEFLLQTVKGKIVHDFTFAVEQAKEFYDWRHEPLNITYIDTDEDGNIAGCLDVFHFPPVPNPHDYIPVGEVGFVSKFLLQYYPEATAALRPLNVPLPLQKYAFERGLHSIYDGQSARRLVYIGITLYRKSLTKIKDPSNGIITVTKPEDIIGYQVSRIVNFVSEWRILVFRDEIKYAACYIGDPLTFPNREKIESMIKDYADAGYTDETGRHGGSPVAYTLDVGITDDGKTQIIECHRFFSCGLYGFQDLAAYPKMLSQAWFEIKNTR